MASTSTSSTTASYKARYDVFLSFRGEDTRLAFTDHLYDALVRAGLRTFRDNDSIGRGEELKSEIERAIGESRASIVLLSENYATSTWCLDELLLILERRRNSNHFVLPVFYHVEPSDVGKLRKGFTIKVNAEEEGDPVSTTWTKHNVNRWETALKEVATLTGKVLTGSETNFIADIVYMIDYKLDRKLVSTPPYLTGMGTRAEYIDSWLKNNQSSSKVLAIWGIGGSGKTTLAKYIYNSNSRKFKNSSFLEDIRKSCEQSHGLLGLQKQLLTDILGSNKRTIPNVSEGTSKIEEALQMERVLLVLDDIDEDDHLTNLLGAANFNTESKIIITTRDRHLVGWFKSKSWRCEVFTLDLLNPHESLELLSWHAFGSKIPMEGFTDLAEQVARYCEGNPLALKVLGSSLFVSAEDSHTRNIESWKSTLNVLKRDFHSGIYGILRRSFDSLPFDLYKELFLHIACFFIGEDEDYMVKILEPECCARAGIITLINRCLLTVSPSNKLMMHQLLQEMGKKIIHGESPRNPAQRSRVWRDRESYDVLMKRKGSQTIEGLALDMQRLEKEKTVKLSALETDSLIRMDNLKLLQLKYVELHGSFQGFPGDLRWLYWHGFCFSSMPYELFMLDLVAIDMSYSNLVEFDPPVVLPSLKILNLKDSHHLLTLRGISQFPNLDTLILWNCYRLFYVCESIGDLQSLALVNMTGCRQRQLLSLPQSLQRLLLNDCNLEYNTDFPINFSVKSCLQYLNLGNNPFEFLPDCNHLRSLRVLDLTCCTRLVSLLCLPSTLEELYTYYCESLEKITFQSHRFTLRELGCGGCFVLSEIEGLFKLVPVAKLDEAGLGHMKWLKEYQDLEVDLIGDEVIECRGNSHIQMMYEFGISSTFLPGLNDANMRSEYMSRSPFLSFTVPSCPMNRRIQGLDVTFIYRLSGQDEYPGPLFANISNTNKDLKWIYNPIAFGKPKVGEDAVWLSYWAIGNTLDVGDVVNVSIILGDGLVVSTCGASLVYTDDEVEKETWQTKMEWEEIIGGDLSAFQLTTGVYYLCRRDIFESKDVDEMTSHWFKILVGDAIQYAEVQGWGKSGRSHQLNPSFTEVKTVRCIIHDPQLQIYKTPNMSKASVEFASSALEEKAKSEFSNLATKDLLDRPPMAAASSSSSSSFSRVAPPLVTNIISDVYLSFRDGNLFEYFTCKGPSRSFALRLFGALRGAGLRASKDSELTSMGEDLRTSEKLITESRSSIVILSEDYSKSHRCLNRLLLILERMRDPNYFVLPVFFHVDKSDVWEQRKSFALQGFPAFVERMGRVDLWKEALTEVATLPGHNIVREDSTNDIEEIVSTVGNALQGV